MDDRRDSGSERGIPSPKVLEKAVRRRFTAEYKLRILAEAEYGGGRNHLMSSGHL